MDKTEVKAYFEETAQPEDVAHFVKSRDVIKVAEGVYLEVDKPSIHSVIWYDDEYPDPFKYRTEDEKFNLFVAENMVFYNFVNIVDDYRENHDRHGGFKNNPEIFYKVDPDNTWRKYKSMLSVYDRYDEYNGDRDRELKYNGFEGGEIFEVKGDDLESLYECSVELKARFEKRLKTYWKRYRDKVVTRGYWANR